MKNTTLIIIILSLNISFSQNDNLMNRYRNDILSETPINPIPKEMTFEEYQDMNRRLNVGLLLAAIPIPGTIHHYAGEKKIAKNIRWVAAGSILAIIGGAMSMKEDGWRKSPYEIYIENPGTDDEKRYQKIPTGEIDGAIKYKYIELEKKYSGASFLIPLGIGVLIGDYLYDYIHGIRTIESKRDKVRFKYGKTLDFSFIPTYDLKNKTAGINFTYDF
jgi:hypothetical protein